MNRSNRALFLVNLVLITTLSGLVSLWLLNSGGVTDQALRTVVGATIRTVALYLYLYVFGGIETVGR